MIVRGKALPLQVSVPAVSCVVISPKEMGSSVGKLALVYVCVCVCVCVRACVRACACACIRAFVHACVQ